MSMKDQEMYQRSKIDMPVVYAIFTSYVLMVIGTILGNDFFYLLMSPITAFLTGTLIMICLRRMGGFWFPSFLLGVGIYVWVIADIITFVSGYITHTDSTDSLVQTLYVFPNYFFGISVAVYFIQKLHGRQLYQFLVNVFTFTIIGFVAFRKILTYANAVNELDTLSLMRVYMYFFINFFIIIMIFHMVYMIATESGLKGTNTMIIGIFVYTLLDIPYNYSIVVGRDPENSWLNLVYMVCMILMAHGIYHQIRHKHVFKLKAYEYNQKNVKRVRWLVLTGILISVILWIVGFFNQNDFTYLLIAMLASWVMTSSFQNGALSEQLMKQQDLLTGLYNRRYSTVVLQECKKTAEDDKETFTVYCIDLNHFKPVNDTYGHDMGDRVLQEFGMRMLKLPPDYISFRMGGDEFMVIRKNTQDEDSVIEGAKILQELFHTPILLDSYVFNLSGSIGVATYGTHSNDADDLVRYSDAAMYAVKHSGQKDNYRIFDSGLVETVEKHRTLEAKLRNASPEHDFILYYQPKLAKDSGKLEGVEVFPRLKGPGNEIYTAGELIPIAEEAGIMSRLGIWIAKEAISTVAKWNRTYNLDMSVSINLAPLQLLDEEFLEELKNTSSSGPMPADRIILEISNDVIMGSAGSSKDTLKVLHDLGFGLVLNDFGGGDINLSHIVDCGFDGIDMSHSLIVRAEKDPEARSLLECIVAIAGALNLSVSAVGIETTEQIAMISGLGVQYVQGYYYWKPMPDVELEQACLR